MSNRAQGVSLKSKLGIGAQAVAALALAAVVYFAFIQSDGSGPLSGIDVQEGIEPGAPPSDTTQAKGERRRGRNGSPALAAPATTTFAEPVVSVSVDTPVGSQYESPVARVAGRLGASQP